MLPWYPIQITATIYFSLVLSATGFALENQPGTVLFEDALNGKPNPGWTMAPQPFVPHPDFGTLYCFTTTKSATPTCGAWAGDETWRNYRVEFEVLYAGEGGGFTGLDFHVSIDGSKACNVGFYMPKEDGQIALEESGRWNENTSWKLYPFSPTSLPFHKNEWIKIRLDTGETIANVYVNDSTMPVYTLYDLPFECGGIRFWEYHLSVYIRNLRVTSLSPNDVKPVLDDRWKQVSRQNVIRDWQITDKKSSNFGADGLPTEIRDPNTHWRTVKSDRRGVVNLIAEFPDNISPGVAFARHTIESDKEIIRKCWVSYTDRLTLWCNGKAVFLGQPRGFYDPGRSIEDGFGRLIPDQFEVELPLKTGKNEIVLRSEVTEPLWGWAFWMRLD